MQAKHIIKDDLLVGTDIWIDTQQWFNWLSSNNAFRYEGKGTNFNCNQRKNGKWYATKKVYATNGGRVVCLYIGNTSDCNLAKLQEIAECFAMDWVSFWQWYYGSDRKEERKSKTKFVQATSDCTNDMEVLQSELQRLQLALEEVTADRDRQLIRIAELQNRMHSEIKSCTVFQQKQLEQLEAYNREIDWANGYLEKDNARLREENQKLKSEVKAYRASAIAPGLENDREVPSHVWAIGSIKPRSELMKGISRRQFDKQGNFPTLPDGSQWRRLGSKHEMEPSEQFIFQGHPSNTVFYVCVR